MSGYPKDHEREQDAQADAGPMTEMELLKKIQQQLVYLERKVDALIAGGGQSQGQGRPPFRDRPFKKPFRPYGDRPYGRPNHDRGAERGGERGGYRPAGEHRPGQGGGYKKKPYYGRREHR